MCGISGFTGKPNQATLKKMSQSLYHRGPDDDGFFANGKINLAFQRLSILDLTTGNQPIHNEDKTLWSVFNGEIYNFPELREKLIAGGHQLYTKHADGELIVHLYEMYGESFVHHMNGMFAIALWDDKENKLTLVRDRMGVKPLFYTKIDGELVFSSEIKGILAHPKYSPAPNYEAIFHYFSLKNIPAPLTAFEGIHSLLPGEMIQFSEGKLVRDRWWTLKFKDKYVSNQNYYKENVLELLEKSVHIRMRCDVPYGACLSGGLDSSLVVGLMSRFATKPVTTFSLGYEDELKNKEADLFCAREVSKVFNTNHHEYIMSSKELVEDVASVINAFDQPFSGTISTYFLSKLIKKHVKVALSGDGADELFGSYLSHRLAQPMHHLSSLIKKISHGISLSKDEKTLLAPIDLNFLTNLYEKSEGDEATWRYNLYLQNDQEKNDLLAQCFVDKIDGISTRSLVKKNFSSLTSVDPLNRILEMEWRTQLPDQILAFVDFLSMAHAVEMRSPFLDYHLVEFAATIPGEFKICKGQVKAVLKKAASSVLPKEIVERPKEGFVLPVFDWMFSKMKNYNTSLLSSKRLRKHDFFKQDRIDKLLLNYHSGYKADAGKIWNLMMFQIWWEKYFG